MKPKSMRHYMKLFFDSFFVNRQNHQPPAYRVLEIFQKEGEYIAKIQIINKNITFESKPEEILAKDRLVDQFSPRDIRTLTYLGYLGINSPKYKILAKKLSENDDKLIFALKKKGVRKVIIKTADQINNEKEIIDNLNSKDAKLVGYTLGSESIIRENIIKNKLSKNSQKESHEDTYKNE